MMNKKNKNANLENMKGLFFLTGLVIALGSILFAFEWKSSPKAVMDLGNATFVQDEFVYIPQTPNEKKELPPQKIEVAFFELVDNDSDLDEDLDFFDTEPTDDNIFDLNAFVFTPTKNKNEEEEVILTFADDMPEFPGGESSLLKFLGSNVRYPVIAQENGIQGRVYVSFVVNETGNINDVCIVRGVDNSLDNEALRVVRSMPKWKPGKQDGKTVKVRYNVPIFFELK
jgi:periplasmic protein TonB